MNIATQRSGWALPTQQFSEYTGQRKINPLLRNVYKQTAYFRGNEYIDKPLLKKRNRGWFVQFPQQRDTLTNQNIPYYSYVISI
jgi:hypothetical protein